MRCVMNKVYPCLAVIPARGGSKGIPNKNIRLLAGKPLLSYAVEAIQDSGIDVDIVVSTDSPAIMKIAESHRNVYVLRRPDDISVDSARTEDALLDALEQMKVRFGKAYRAVMTVQPTSPFRRSETISRFWNKFELLDDGYDALLTLSETRADYWIDDNGLFRRLYPDAPRRRQDRKPLYVENSCLYATTTEALLATQSVLGNRVQGFLISEEEALDINDPIDLLVAESRMKAFGG